MRFIWIVIVALLVGCDSSHMQTPTNEYQRFIPVAVDTFGGGLALDTKTGQTCRTWNLQLNFEVIKQSPLCKALYDADVAKK